jgi:hypothetical protein
MASTPDKDGSMPLLVAAMQDISVLKRLLAQPRRTPQSISSNTAVADARASTWAPLAAGASNGAALRATLMTSARGGRAGHEAAAHAGAGRCQGAAFNQTALMLAARSNSAEASHSSRQTRRYQRANRRRNAPIPLCKGTGVPGAGINRVARLTADGAIRSGMMPRSMPRVGGCGNGR